MVKDDFGANMFNKASFLDIAAHADLMVKCMIEAEPDPCKRSDGCIDAIWDYKQLALYARRIIEMQTY